MRASSTSLISLCTRQHGGVWKISSTLIPDFVKANDYKVYVPENDYKFLRRIASPKFLVMPETALSLEFRQPLLQAVEKRGRLDRFGWYFQQFLKLQALIEDENENLIIWDSDCIPVRIIDMFDQSVEPIMYSAPEYNPDYFPPIKRLLNLDKVHPKSFIVPGFPIKKPWVADFISEIEEVHGLPWYQAIINAIDFSKPSGFSEYETLGTWVSANRQSHKPLRDLNWERFGQSRFGYPKRLGRRKIVRLARQEGLDVVSFEVWDLRGLRLLAKGIRGRLNGFLLGRKKQKSTLSHFLDQSSG